MVRVMKNKVCYINYEKVESKSCCEKNCSCCCSSNPKGEEKDNNENAKKDKLKKVNEPKGQGYGAIQSENKQ